MLAGYIAKLICHLLLGWYMLAQNRKRDRENGPADVKKAAELVRPRFRSPSLACPRSLSLTPLFLSSHQGMRNVTEKSNPDFRYVL